MLDVTPEGRVSHVLTNLGEALAAHDLERALALFQDDCYWRDLVAFTWNIKTVEGKDAVRAMLKAQLSSVKPSAWTLDSAAGVSSEGGVTTGWFTFETDVFRGYGHVRLKDGKIWTLLTTAVELKGHEEPLGVHRPLGAKHGAGKHRPTWKEEREEEAQDAWLHETALCRHRRRRPGRHRPRRATPDARRPDHHRREERAAGRQLAQPLQVALPARSGLVRPHAVSAVPAELAGVLAQGQDRRLARDVYEDHGAELLGLHDLQKGQLRRGEEGMDSRRRARRQGDHAAAETARARDRHVGQAQHSEFPRHGALQGRPASFVEASRTGRLRRQDGGHHRLEQFRPRHRGRALGERRRCDDGAALLDPHRAFRHADGHRSGRALFREGGEVRHRPPPRPISSSPRSPIASCTSSRSRSISR